MYVAALGSQKSKAAKHSVRQSATKLYLLSTGLLSVDGLFSSVQSDWETAQRDLMQDTFSPFRFLFVPARRARISHVLVCDLQLAYNKRSGYVFWVVDLGLNLCVFVLYVSIQGDIRLQRRLASNLTSNQQHCLSCITSHSTYTLTRVRSLEKLRLT